VVVVPLAGVRAERGALAIAAALGISRERPGGRLGQRPRPDLGARIIAPRRAGDAAGAGQLRAGDRRRRAVGGGSAGRGAVAADPDHAAVRRSRSPRSACAPLEPLEIEATQMRPPSASSWSARRSRVRGRRSISRSWRGCADAWTGCRAIELALRAGAHDDAEQIERRLENRFALLTTGDRAAPERHRTLEAVIEWSWDLLSPDARQALALLSVLPGFSAETADAVLSAASDDVLEGSSRSRC
jgi:hypothetical protein